MNCKDYIGEIIGGAPVCIGKNAPNKHIVMTGISGSGKSRRMAEIEKNIIKGGGTIIAFDVNGTHTVVEGADYNYISVQQDGLDVEFLDLSLVEQGKETETNLVQYVMETLCPKELRGARQLGVVRDAIKEAIANKGRFSNDTEAISYGLQRQDEKIVLGVYNYLCPILDGNIFRRSEKKIEEGKLNIITLQGINPKTQKRVVEIMLNVLWRKIRIAGNTGKEITLELDEFQSLDLTGKESPIFEMLTESRKYGVRLIFATQTLTIFNRRDRAIINQAATKLFFQQSVTDIKEVAEMIEPGHKEKWILALSRLRIGQAIAVGEIELNGRALNHPVITYVECQELKTGLHQLGERRRNR